MTRNYLLIGILAFNVTTPAVAGIQCSISDWPLEMPHGTADFIRVFAPGLTVNTVVTHHHTSTRTVASHPSSANAAPTLAPRNWKDRRSPTPSQWQKLFYAVMDDDGAQVERLLGSTRVDLNVPLSSDGRGSLLNVAAGLGEPDVARVLIAHGAHVHDQPGDSIQLHPIADAVGGLEGYLNTRDLPDPFFNRPPGSAARYLAVIHMLLDAGADPDALAVPSETLSPLGNLMFAPRFAGDVELVRLLVAHGASVDGPPPIRSPLGIALDKGYDDYATALLADHHVSAATLNHGLIMAIAREDVAMGQTLLGSGADANFKIGTVPVLCRTLDSREMHSLALALLAHRADANVDCGDPRSGGGTPLTLVDPDDHELIDLLVARGGELGVPAADGTLYRSHGVDPGPINWALLHHRDHVASALLAREPSAAHECGAVVYAARYGATETLARLLALGGDPNSSSADGVSALMAAAFHGQTGTLKVLLAQPRIEIDRTTQSHFNPGYFKIQLEGSQPPLVYGSRTALMFAALGGSVDATSLLIAHGARLQQKDAEGLKAAEYAHNDAVAQLFAGGANATN
jgi:ankyrin repeat protein